MKKIIIILIVLGIAGTAGFFFMKSKGATVDMAGWQAYQSEKYGISLKYPTGYEAKEVNASEEGGLLVTFMKPDEEKAAVAILNIAPQTLDIDAMIKELGDPKYASANVKVSDVLIADKNGKKITAQAADDRTSTLYVFNDNNRAISLTITGKSIAEIGDSMISSLVLY